ncbi:DUF2637 domain-containing protein [Cryobacterium tagatosivorans]|uniref:DUF2637 domain-containing protein n=1 Tax=Cryobacterium tagatosivorans TaxID=1259199 RepID=A0A4R8UFW8_9MICO|nr:DUF2637 domain-containing protein [Cryobacterium tagatosivorans]TFB53641.1 DUF2637 domain-containing protein [Cryobacterium tagatosivorans]
MNTTRGASAPVRVSRWLTAVATVLVAGISMLAFVLSFEVLRDLAFRSGVPADIAWAWPLIVDGSIVTAMLVIFAWRGRSRRATAWPWVTLSGFATVSVVGNGVHTAAVYDQAQGISMAFAIFVGAIPPVGLLLSSEMLVRLLTPAEEPAAELVSTGDAVVPMTSVPVSLTVVDDTAVVDTVAAVTVLDTGMAEVVAPDAVTVTPDAVTVAPATRAPELVTPVDQVTRLHAVESIPNDRAGQVNWIVSRATTGHDVTKETLAQQFEESGKPLTDRTVLRRLADARKQAPDMLRANG